MNKHNFRPPASSTNDECLKKKNHILFFINHLCCRHIKHIGKYVEATNLPLYLFLLKNSFPGSVLSIR